MASGGMTLEGQIAVGGVPQPALEGSRDMASGDAR
jgi:hypothetical protein